MLNQILLISFCGAILAMSPKFHRGIPRPAVGPDGCEVGKIKCKNVDKCILPRQQCDGTLDCTDDLAPSEIDNSESDEDDEDDDHSDEGAHCEEFTCLNEWRKCDDNVACVRNNWWCDWYPNCPDGSDETEQNCPDRMWNRRRNFENMKTNSVDRKSGKHAKYANNQALNRLSRMLKLSRI